MGRNLGVGAVMRALMALDAAFDRVAADTLRARAALLALCLILFLPWFAGYPVTDRDEALFAQSSRQMAQTGDVVRIRFLDEARNKKPVGIYWLQAAAASLTTGPDATAIWPYRLPSLIAAILAVALTHALALRFASPGAALAAGMLLASCLVLAGEARLAKTDAALLAATLGAMAVLVRSWLDRPARLTGGEVVAFWGCLAAAVLLKGPVGPLVVALTWLALSLDARSLDWSKPLLRGKGLLLFAALCLPWFAAITWIEGMAFWQASLGGDLLGKVAEGQEGHGLPPGSHLLALSLSFWPASALLIVAVAEARRVWPHKALVLALAWVVPFWLVLELTPTKLLHYTLPVFPALAIATATVFLAHDGAPRPVIRWLSTAAATFGLALPGSAIVLSFRLGGEGKGGSVLLALFALVCLMAFAGALRQGLRKASVVCLVAMAGFAHAATLTATARTPWLWPTTAVAHYIATLPECPGRQLLAVGFREPSLAFQSPVPVVWSAPESASHSLARDPCVVVLAGSDESLGIVTALVSEADLTVTLIEGFALGAGRSVRLTLVHRKAVGPPQANAADLHVP